MHGAGCVSSDALYAWTDSVEDYLKRILGKDSPQVTGFRGMAIAVTDLGDPNPEETAARDRMKDLGEHLTHLRTIVKNLTREVGFEQGATSKPKNGDLWLLLHAKVVKAAQERFENGHFADAVEASFKELNSVVKDMVKKKTGQELDGTSLMQKAFSPNAPVLIALDDLSTQSGQSIQEGYMQIFAGSMKGIRNPKAHANLTISRERCIHFLFLASLLFCKLDERL
ncbi:MAG: TIGR02391 family protein [Planctomycetota bacterium]|nr:TIGR02391 family protein [Planctomycetota bacterium]